MNRTNQLSSSSSTHPRWPIAALALVAWSLLVCPLRSADGPTRGQMQSFRPWSTRDSIRIANEPLRAQMAGRLERGDLGIDAGVALTLSQQAPDAIVAEVMGFRHDWAAHFAVGCLTLGQAKPTDTSALAKEIFCACTDAWTTSYLVVLRREGGAWTKAWDTTRASPLPNIFVDTIRLGIEPAGYPTMVASGIAGPKGPREFVLLSWDGKRATVLSQKLMVGQWMDTVDVNNDGIKELDLPRNGDKEGTYLEQVFTFDKPSKSYKYVPGLKTGRYEKKDQR